MGIKQVQVKVNDLALGMFISSLDRPWTQTPFPIQGFLVRSPQDIDTLRSYCEYVYIDITKGRSVVATGKGAFLKKTGANFQSPDQYRVRSTAQSPLKVQHGVYETVTPLRNELAGAHRIFMTLKGNLTLFAKQLARGRQIDYPSLKRSVDSMVDSVLRCPDAFTWLLRLRKQDQQTYDHSLRSALWAVQFARFVGMSKEEIQVLCTGTLLKDIGKMRVPNELLHKAQRSSEEALAYRRFVEYGVEMLRNTHQVEPKVISVVRYHCERFDGSGFPEGLVGSKIPLLAQVCGIASVYDGISNPKESSQPLASSRAMSRIYNMRDRMFREDLVLQFIQSVGLYPTGTMVELTTGDIGVVVEQDPKSRLTPQIAVLSKKNNGESSIVVNLKDEMEARELLRKNGSAKARLVPKLAIARDLEPSLFDIDIAAISPQFLAPKEEQEPSLLGSLKNRLLRRPH